MAATLITI